MLDRSTLLLFILLGMGFCTLPQSLQAQFTRVEFDYTYAYFNNGQPLPAEEQMVITGAVADDVDMVELAIYRAKSNPDKLPLFQGSWKRRGESDEDIFRIPVNYRLTGSSDYDIRITYYRSMQPAEKQMLKQDLHHAVDGYVRQSVEVRGGKGRLTQSVPSLMSDLNTLVSKSLYYYRSFNEVTFTGFSDVTRQALSQLDKTPEASLDSALAQVTAILHAEIRQVINARLVARTDVREVKQYETQRTRRPLSLNVGYGGVFLPTEAAEGFNYDTSPYVGLSLPLANPRLGGRFWANTSVSLGVFLTNFEDADGGTITGPIFGRPYYLGLGYNVFRFIRINFGATAIEQEGTSAVGNGSASLDVSAISIRPFVGISAEFDVWVGVKEKR